MNLSNVTILIVTYNSATEISNLLNDVHSCLPGNTTIVIDNASSDETVQTIQRHTYPVHLIQNSTNVGYAKAVNQGFALCQTEHVLLLNPDIRINSAQVLSEMEMCLRQVRSIAAVAPLQFKSDDKKHYLNFTWSYMTRSALKLYLWSLFGRKYGTAAPIQVTFLNAGCLMIRRAAFEHVGGLNEKYFLYGEEPDLFLKFKRYGFQSFLLPNVAVTHYRERSLMTKTTWQRLRIRYSAVCNIADALIHGWTGILLDTFAARRSLAIRGRRPTYKKRPSSNPG